jgi:hypothetical protein
MQVNSYVDFFAEVSKFTVQAFESDGAFDIALEGAAEAGLKPMDYVKIPKSILIGRIPRDHNGETSYFIDKDGNDCSVLADEIIEKTIWYGSYLDKDVKILAPNSEDIIELDSEDERLNVISMLKSTSRETDDKLFAEDEVPYL